MVKPSGYNNRQTSASAIKLKD
uniref:Uncharacterized protein n=1 Tax=Rhizophora mucronata TaxID=61149 RepID=A0A2P2IRE4_RHIMU